MKVNGIDHSEIRIVVNGKAWDVDIDYCRERDRDTRQDFFFGNITNYRDGADDVHALVSEIRAAGAPVDVHFTEGGTRVHDRIEGLDFKANGRFIAQRVVYCVPETP